MLNVVLTALMLVPDSAGPVSSPAAAGEYACATSGAGWSPLDQVGEIGFRDASVLGYLNDRRPHGWPGLVPGPALLGQ